MIEDTKDALNGIQRLSKAKAKAIQYVQSLSYINDAILLKIIFTTLMIYHL